MIGYLYCYDIPDDRLRDRIATALLHHGQRVQESVYELWFKTPAQHAAQQRSLRELIGADAACNLRWYGLGADSLRNAGSFDPYPPRPPPSAVLWT